MWLGNASQNTPTEFEQYLFNQQPAAEDRVLGTFVRALRRLPCLEVSNQGRQAKPLAVIGNGYGVMASEFVRLRRLYAGISQSRGEARAEAERCAGHLFAEDIGAAAYTLVLLFPCV